MSIPRRLGRLARGFVLNIQEDDRFRETIRVGRERGETLKGALGAAWKGASEEWRAAERERDAEERASGERASWRRAYERRSERRSSAFMPRRYPPEVMASYHRLGLAPGTSLEETRKKRRELVKRCHPDRFSDAEKRARAERLTAEINAAHDAIARHLLRGG